MDSLRLVPLHRALTRQHLMLGGDRDLFFSLLLMSLLLGFSGVMAGRIINVLLAALLMIGGVPILAKLAVYDSYFKDIIVRSMRYSQTCLPAAGKLGDSTIRVLHKRWY